MYPRTTRDKHVWCCHIRPLNARQYFYHNRSIITILSKILTLYLAMLPWQRKTPIPRGRGRFFLCSPVSRSLSGVAMTIAAFQTVESFRIRLEGEFGDSATAPAAFPISLEHLTRLRTKTIALRSWIAMTVAALKTASPFRIRLEGEFGDSATAFAALPVSLEHLARTISVLHREIYVETYLCLRYC